MINFDEVPTIRNHLAHLLDISYFDIVLVDYESRVFKIYSKVHYLDLPEGVVYHSNGYLDLSEEYVDYILKDEGGSQMNSNKLSYARQQQLDNAVKAFYKGFGNTDTEEDYAENDTSMDNKSSEHTKNTLKYEASYMVPLHTNAAGGRQSHVARDYTLIPQEALASLARVMYNGALKYSKDNWKLIHKRDHLNHALNHINLYLAGNTTEDHLAHAATRMMMALELDLTEENDDA